MVDIVKYADMQRTFYDAGAKRSPEEIVGSYDYHENVPYETQLLFKYGDIRKPIFADFQNRRAFDMCCGEGRMIRRMQKIFQQCDGADISAGMVNFARERSPGANVYVATGANAGGAQSNTYDFAFCTISMQHICVHETRDQITNDLVRILKPDGKMTLQYLFSKHYPFVPTSQPILVGDVGIQAYRNDTHHARWHDNKTDATGTNSGCDVVIGTNEIAVVEADLRKKFENVEYWFYDISIGRSGNPRPLSYLHPNSHLGDDYWGTHFMFVHCEGPKK